MVTLDDLQNKINARRSVVGGDFVLPADHDADKAILQDIHDLLTSGGGGVQSATVQYIGDGNASHIIPVGFASRSIIIVESNPTAVACSAYIADPIDPTSGWWSGDVAASHMLPNMFTASGVDVGVIDGYFGGANGVGNTYIITAYS